MKSALLLILVAGCWNTNTADDDDYQPPVRVTTYTVNAIGVPATQSEGEQVGLDLNGDGNVDNQVGVGLGLSLGEFDIDASAPTFREIQIGRIDLPVVIQTSSYVDADTAQLQVGPGGTNGSFDHGVYFGSGEAFTVTFALDDGILVAAPLIHTQVRADGISDDGISELTLAGYVDPSWTNDTLAPAAQVELTRLVARDCIDPPSNTKICGCPMGTPGLEAINLFDTDMDCAITLAEVQANSAFLTVFAPDACSDGATPCTHPDLISFGLRATAIGTPVP